MAFPTKQLKADRLQSDAQKIVGVAGAAIADGDILFVTGMGSGSNAERLELSPADKDDTDAATRTIWVADHAAPVGSLVRAVSWKVLSGDSSAAANVGATVWLGDGGAWTATLPSPAVVIGEVIVDAVAGRVLVGKL